MTSYTLRKPIRVIDQTITVLQFREPTGTDLIGLPDMDADKIGFSIALADRVASNVPAGTVKGLSALDALGAWLAAAQMLDPTMPAGSSTDTSSALAGGATSPS